MDRMTRLHTKPVFDCLGWVAQIQVYRGTSRLTLKKEAVVGCNLVKGEPLHCYLIADHTEREIAVVFLDGKPCGELNKLGAFSWRTSVQQGGRRSSRFTISKAVAIGSGFNKSNQLFLYTGWCGKRRAVFVYLDGKPRHKIAGGDFRWRKKPSTSIRWP